MLRIFSANVQRMFREFKEYRALLFDCQLDFLPDKFRESKSGEKAAAHPGKPC